jgi:uncharacterized protein YndB with AHSA1/START domain
MATGTVKFHRVFKAPAERVYRAFLDPDALVKWLPPTVLLRRFIVLMQMLVAHTK